MPTDSAAAPVPVEPGIPQHKKIIAGLIAGMTLGLLANWIAQASGNESRIAWLALNIAEPIGRIFLRMMFMVVVPLVFSALALAVIEIGDVRRLGRIGLRTLFFTGLLSSAAVILGITLVNVIQPGKSLAAEKRDELQRRYVNAASDSVDKAAQAKPLRDVIVDLLPENPFQEMVGAVDGKSKGNGMLAVMVFSLFFGAAVAAAPRGSAVLINWLEGLNSVSQTIIGWAMRIAPLGAGCLVFSITAQLGFDILKTLFWFVATVVLGLGLHLVVVYPTVIALFSRMTPRAFFRGARNAMLVAFGTSSSTATLPTAIKVAETDLKLPSEVSRFVLTVGATGNQNGTALYEGVVVLFLAQVFNVELTMAAQLQVVLMSILAGVGTAGVPGGSLPLIVVLMRSVGVPGEAIGIIMGVDRLLDMCRTTLNVTGDLVVATCVAGGPEQSAAAGSSGDRRPIPERSV